MAPRSPTPQGISRLLADAKFRRATTGRSGSSGFVVTKDRSSDRAVRVRHHFWSMGATGEQHQAMLDRYAETLTAAGWHVDAGGRELVVTARKDEQQ